jgi:peroxiredoxin
MLTITSFAAATLLNAAPAPSLSATPADRLGHLSPGLGLAVGTKAPDVSLNDLAGHTTTLKSLYARGSTLVVFYRGGWCPWCNLQLHELASKQAEFKRRGVTLVPISVDLPTEAAKTQATHTLPFTLLSDPTLVAHEAFKVVHHANDAEIAALKGFGADVEAHSGQTHHSFAVPSVFLVSRPGVVLWAHADEDFKTRPSADQLLTLIDTLMPATEK